MLKKQLYPDKVHKVVEALLTSDGHADPSLRQAIEAHAAMLGGAERTPGEVPEELLEYVEKVALHAYKTTDEDIDKLKQAGYSEDQLFEITLSAALGASLARLERGMLALQGKK